MSSKSLGEDPMEQEMVTCSGILAWEIPWTEEAGRLQSIGSQRVAYDLATKEQPQQRVTENLLPPSALHPGKIQEVPCL